MVFGVGKGLRGSYDNRLSGMDAEGVEILHVADRDAVVEPVAHHFIFHLFPALEALFYKYLWREGEGFFSNSVQFFLVVAESGPQSSESISGTDDDGISEFFGGTAGILDILYGFRLDGLYVDFIKFLDKELAVFGVDDGLYGSSQYLHIVFVKSSGAEEFHTAVQCGLSAKGKHDALGAFLFDYAFYEIRCDG